MTDRRALAVLVVLHLAMVAIVAPRGDFPLNDDWAFAQSVRWFLDGGGIRLSSWVAMNLVPQTMAGGIVASIFGFSFESLRHLTQVVAVLAMFAAYAWFRAAHLDSRAALVATVCVVSFPAWPVLANSFMTDLYGLALALAAAAYFAKALETRSSRAMVAATLFSTAGVLERQVALAIPFAFLVASLWSPAPVDRRAIMRAAAPFVVVLLAAIGFHLYLTAGPGVPEGQRVAHGRLVPMLVNVLTNEGGAASWAFANVAGIAAYLGLFAVGWLAWWGLGHGRGTKHAVLIGGLILVAITVALSGYPPYRENYVIDRAGIGPFLLHDSIRGAAPLDRSPGIFWRALAVPTAFATAALVVAAVRAIGSSVNRASAQPATVFTIAVLIAYLGPFAVTDYFDRYLLFALPFLFSLCARVFSFRASRAREALAIAWLAASIGLASAATHDYFSWNRARWDAIHAAEKMGATPDAMDAGFEYGGLTRFEKRDATVPAGKSWYWVKDDRFVVAFSSVPGYEDVAVFKVAHWLPRTPGEIKLLRRKA